jgi:hypothetical protein
MLERTADSSIVGPRLAGMTKDVFVGALTKLLRY